MKKDWQSVYDMLTANSGFDYDKYRNCVTTNVPRVWETYLENHKWAAKWENEKLPHYEELYVIFWKDGAQGNRAKSFIEMEVEVNAEEQEQDVQGEETSSARNKKMKNMNKSNSMLKSFNDVVSLRADRLQKSSIESSEGIKFEMDLERKKAMITNALSKMTSMTQFERF
ncbi:hypothetical protein L1987_11790 [Smallanthus sonchifolius]|uniref:Uncharacterized protein n=1 Tax=Smallanthus sonchifolius TaxID=185202 RepID=A0ACB9JBY9_9ASTR|nr:hypothetical protein L1987_11790 [Smallanthus sonchifolius]